MPKAVGQAVTVGLRPESLTLATAGNGIPMIVNIVEELGAEAFLHAQLASEADAIPKAARNIIARIEPHAAPAKGDLIHLHVKEDSLLFFDAATGERIRSSA